MKRLGQIWGKICSFENLWIAYRKARLGKTLRPSVALFSMNVEKELMVLQRELRDGSYQPGEYRLFTIYERKPRAIAAAPFRDRVVHHAIMNLLEPTLDRSFINDSYACRKGKGVHRAVDRFQRWAQRYTYVLKLDVEQYFSSIDHPILKEKLHRKIKDRSSLALLEKIIDASPQNPKRPLDFFRGDDLLTPLGRGVGIPIGNLTSQFFANLFLDDLDHFIKQELRVKGYLRYVDDMVLLADSKTELAEYREIIREKLEDLRLRVHPRKAHISRAVDGLNLFGYLVYRDYRRLRNDNGYRFARKLRGFAKAYEVWEVDWDTLNSSVQSWIGHAKHADIWGLRTAIFSDIVFRRGPDPQTNPRAAWRLLEQ